jgi:integrase
LVTRYRDSVDYKNLAASTRKNWLPWLDRIASYFGDLRIAQFDRPGKVRKVIRVWRNKWAGTPRTADYGMQVLSRVLAFSVEQGDIAGNPCKGIPQLYSSDRSEVIWTDSDIVALKQRCLIEMANAVDLASHTGLREGDCCDFHGRPPRAAISGPRNGFFRPSPHPSTSRRSAQKPRRL